MESRRTEFWVLVPPRGDGGPAALQSRLFREGILLLPPPWSFSALGSLPEKPWLRAQLPLSTGDWILTGGWLALETSLPPGPESALFPPGLWILGQAGRIPEFSPPRFIFRSLRVQRWIWDSGDPKLPAGLEVSVLEEFRAGGALSPPHRQSRVPLNGAPDPASRLPPSPPTPLR